MHLDINTLLFCVSVWLFVCLYPIFEVTHMTHREALWLVEVEHFFTIKNIEIFDLHRQKIRKNLRRINKWHVQSSKLKLFTGNWARSALKTMQRNIKPWGLRDRKNLTYFSSVLYLVFCLLNFILIMYSIL